MAMVIANNVPSLTAQRHLTRSTIGLARSLEKLSSGLRVNRGADDPAGLVISEKQRAQISGLEKAIENTDKAISLLQTAEGALNEINLLLTKIRSLALDSANTGVNDDDALAANQSEVVNALETIARIADNTQFGTKKLLDGSSGIQGVPSQPTNVTFLRGSSDTVAGTYALTVTTPGQRATLEASVVQAAALASSEILIINGRQVTLAAGLTQSEVVDRINSFTDQTGVLADANGTGGATRLFTVAFGTSASLVVSASLPAAANTSGIGTTAMTAFGVNAVVDVEGTAVSGDGNIVEVMSGPAEGLVFQLAIDTGANANETVSGAVGNITALDNSLAFQIGPNQYQMAKVAIGLVNPAALGLGVTGNQFNSLAEIDVSSEIKAQATIGVVDQAIDDVTTLRGFLGAFQKNTLESTANNLRGTLENTINAESVIRDTDFAKEVAVFTKHQVLIQAGTSVLANANQSAHLVLSLLQ
jgi:flagellin